MCLPLFVVSFDVLQTVVCRSSGLYANQWRENVIPRFTDGQPCQVAVFCCEYFYVGCIIYHFGYKWVFMFLFNVDHFKEKLSQDFFFFFFFGGGGGGGQTEFKCGLVCTSA